MRTTADVGGVGSTIELDGGGTISDSVISHNASTVTSADGDATITGAVALLNFNNDPKLATIRDTIIDHNTATASSTAGSAAVQGAGIFNDSLLALQRVQVRDNVGRAHAPAGRAQGGGIWNSDELSGPPVHLTLDDTVVTRNTLLGSPGITIQGGGLFTTFPVAQTASRIIANAPDQCFGC